VSLVVASETAFWAGLAAIMPEKYHTKGMVILGALTSAITILMRGGRPSIPEVVKDAVEEKKAEIVTGDDLDAPGASRRSPFDT